jgi:hypothetical protein
LSPCCCCWAAGGWASSFLSCCWFLPKDYEQLSFISLRTERCHAIKSMDYG